MRCMHAACRLHMTPPCDLHSKAHARCLARPRSPDLRPVLDQRQVEGGADGALVAGALVVQRLQAQAQAQTHMGSRGGAEGGGGVLTVPF